MNRSTTKAFKVTPPDITDTEEAKQCAEDFSVNEDLYNLRLKNEILSGIHKECADLNNSVFTQCCLGGCKFHQIQLTDVIFDNCDLSNVDFSYCIFSRVEFVNCKMMGTNFSESTLNHVGITQCNCRYANFAFVKMKNVLFSHDDLQSGIFNECKFTPLVFETCSFIESEFFHTPLQGIDFRDSQIEGMRLDPQDIRGTIVTSLQAIELSRVLGIIIKD